MAQDKHDKKARSKSAWRQWIEAIVIAVILALFIRTFLVQAYEIPSGSMEPTLLVGDRVLVCKFWYGLHVPLTDVTLFRRLPRRGDVVVFKPPPSVQADEDYIKRVIGLPGDVVRFRQGSQIWIRPAGHEKFRRFAFLEGPHVRRRPLAPRDIKVPPGKLFLMGDNRDNSSDSREWGFADLKDVRGKAFMIYWSWYGWSSNEYLGWRDHTTLSMRWYRLNPFSGLVWIPGVRRRGPLIDRRFPSRECAFLKDRVLKQCRAYRADADRKCAAGSDRTECRQARWRAARACDYAAKMKQDNGFCPAKTAQAKPVTPQKKPAAPARKKPAPKQ